jgi:hypothetical protein
MNEALLTRSLWQNPATGWFAACVAASVVASCFFFSETSRNPDIVFLLFGLVLGLSFIPSLITVLICETYSIRNPISYILTGIISAVVVARLTFGADDAFAGMLFASVGSSMGLTYWFVSGRYSGLRFHRKQASG